MTVLVPLFYLWLAITVLLAAMFLLHRLDLRRLRNDEHRFPDLRPGIGEGHTDEGMIGGRPIGTDDDTGGDRLGDDRIEVDDATSCPPVMDLLRGAVLPHDLAPVTERIAEPERHAILLSPNRDAEEVGTAFADELTRLGFAIEPHGHDQATATRGGQVLMLKICPEAGTRGSGGYRRYPTAAATDVAIEIWTGDSSPPPLAD